MDSTVILGIAGVGGTLAAALGTPFFTARYADASQLRAERQLLYVDAMKHCAELRFLYFSEEFESRPLGGAATPPPQDEVTARMALIAHAGVMRAWSDLVEAERALSVWGYLEYTGAPDDAPPENLLGRLKQALAGLEAACNKAVRNRR